MGLFLAMLTTIRHAVAQGQRDALSVFKLSFTPNFIITCPRSNKTMDQNLIEQLA